MFVRLITFSLAAARSIDSYINSGLAFLVSAAKLLFAAGDTRAGAGDASLFVELAAAFFAECSASSLLAIA